MGEIPVNSHASGKKHMRLLSLNPRKQIQPFISLKPDHSNWWGIEKRKTVGTKDFSSIDLDKLRVKGLVTKVRAKLRASKKRQLKSSYHFSCCFVFWSGYNSSLRSRFIEILDKTTLNWRIINSSNLVLSTLNTFQLMNLYFFNLNGFFNINANLYNL